MSVPAFDVCGPCVPWSWAWGNCVRVDSRLTVTGPDQLSPPPSRFRYPALSRSLLALDFFQVAPAVKPSPTSSKIAVAALPVDNPALCIPTFPGFLLGFWGSPFFVRPHPQLISTLLSLFWWRSCHCAATSNLPVVGKKRLGSLALAQQTSQGRARPPSNTYLIYRYLYSSILRRFRYQDSAEHPGPFADFSTPIVSVRRPACTTEPTVQTLAQALWAQSAAWKPNSAFPLLSSSTPVPVYQTLDPESSIETFMPSSATSQRQRRRTQQSASCSFGHHSFLDDRI